MTIQSQIHYRCANGMGVRRSVVELDYATASKALARQLNSQLGVLLASGFEYPGRYTRWDIRWLIKPRDTMRLMRLSSVRSKSNPTTTMSSTHSAGCCTGSNDMKRP